eukprot:TRINITY_DN2921_c0_g2_i7.p1 TRINITY_DN2921_c0_g2~~TRINITY_DN2921_c0_g2_i7.p1  ORF type:complete len:215 (+),score=20.57 TRINITY_DN2921_c0_g2_i7:136-780(+)
MFRLCSHRCHSTLSTKKRSIIFAGPSGVGKGTLITALLKEFPDKFELVCSHTTRPKRVGEVHGIHYYYVSHQEFEQDIKKGKFLEYNFYNGNYYGTSEDSLDVVESKGKIPIIEIDIKGCQSIKKKGFNFRIVFISPPPPEYENLVQRLKGRGTENEEVIQRRVAHAKKELEFKDTHPNFFDTIIVNDLFPECYKEIKDFLKDDITDVVPGHME